MKQGAIFILGVLCLFQLLNAQDDMSTKEVPDVNHLFRIDILAPGIGGEVAFRHIGSFQGSANLGFGGGASFSSMETDGYFFISPQVQTELRAYFNRDKRVVKGKPIKGNSGLFAGVHLGYYAPDIYASNKNYELGHSIVAGPIFGVQRTFDCNIQLGFSCGLGVMWDEFHDFSMGAPGKFNFSYVILPKKQKKEVELD